MVDIGAKNPWRYKRSSSPFLVTRTSEISESSTFDPILDWFALLSKQTSNPRSSSILSSMAGRIAARYISRRSSSSGKILSEEEKAAENVYIKKIEQEKLEKLARKGPKPEETPKTSSVASASEPKPNGPSSSTSGGVSTDKNRNYAVLAGVITGLGALGWYLKSSSKKPEEVQD